MAVRGLAFHIFQNNFYPGVSLLILHYPSGELNFQTRVQNTGRKCHVHSIIQIRLGQQAKVNGASYPWNATQRTKIILWETS